jgi:hypothetical protein
MYFHTKRYFSDGVTPNVAHHIALNSLLEQAHSQPHAYSGENHIQLIAEGCKVYQEITSP